METRLEVEDASVQAAHGAEANDMGVLENWGVPYFGFLIRRILLFRVQNWGPLFSETPNIVRVGVKGSGLLMRRHVLLGFVKVPPTSGQRTSSTECADTAQQWYEVQEVLMLLLLLAVT